MPERLLRHAWHETVGGDGSVSDYVPKLSPLERWLYFLQHPAEIEPELW